MSLENSGARKQQIEASYLASNLSWNADYVLTVARDDKNADLDGWVTVVNNSGTAFRNARLQLVAGELNRVPTESRIRAMDETRALSAKAAPRSSNRKLSANTISIPSAAKPPWRQRDQTNQFAAGQWRSRRENLHVNGQSYYYRNQQNPSAPLKDPVMVYYKFKNEEKAGLGIPLPAETSGSIRKTKRRHPLAGEDRIDHTPKDEFVNIHIGNVFDVVAEHKQTDTSALTLTFGKWNLK